MSLVFSVEVNLKTLTITGDIIFTPSLSITISDNEETVFPWTPTEKESQNQNFEIKKTYQIMVATDLFSAIKSWPISFNIATQEDSVVIGSTVFEFKPMLANALSACGRSKSKEIEAVMKNQDRKEIARLKLVATVEYIPGNEHSETVEIIASQNIDVKKSQEKTYQPKLESSQIREETELEDSDVSVQSLSSSSKEYTSEKSLLDGHSNFKSAGQTNRSKLSSAQRNLSSTNKSNRTGITKYSSALGSTFANDFIDEDI